MDCPRAMVLSGRGLEDSPLEEGVGPPDKTPILNFANLIFKAVAMSGRLPAYPSDSRCSTPTVSTTIRPDVEITPLHKMTGFRPPAHAGCEVLIGRGG